MISDTAVIMQMFHENICRNLNKTKATAFFFCFCFSFIQTRDQSRSTFNAVVFNTVCYLNRPYIVICYRDFALKNNCKCAVKVTCE